VDSGTAPEIIPCTYNSVVSAWQNGYAFVFWSAHGSAVHAEDVLTSSLCPNLDDTRPSFVFQNSCSTGHPETPGNLGFSLLKNGAIATVAASRVSWYGGLDYLNGDKDESLKYRYATRLARWGQRCGPALAFTKADALPNEEYGWDNYAMYNLYGDPSLAGITTIDECSGAEQITSLPFSVVVDDVSLATGNPTDPALTCGSGSYPRGSHSVWFKFTPTETAQYQANTFPSTYDTVLAVLQGACGSYTQVACNDDYAGSTRSFVNWQGQAGVTYLIEITSYGTTAAGVLCLEVRKPNDECSQAEVIGSLPYEAWEYTGYATTAANDPILSCGRPEAPRGGRSVWHRFQPTHSAWYQVSASGSSYDVVTAVFSGSCGSLTEVACGVCFVGQQQSLQFYGQAGQQYYVETASYLPSDSGILRLRLSAVPPSNDEMAGAISIGSLPYTNSQDTRGATRNDLDPWITCSGRGSHSVWYKIVTTGIGASLEVNTFGSNYDTAIAVFSRTVDGQGKEVITEVACNNNSGGSTQSRLAWLPLAGVDYYLIEVTSYGNTNAGDLTLTVKTAAPPNDYCSTPVIINAVPYSGWQYTDYATQGEFDPQISCQHPTNPKGDHSVWFRFTPAVTAGYAFSTAGSDYDTVVAVFTGACAAQTQVACNNEYRGSSQATVQWRGEAGVTYYIEVTSYGSTPGGFLLVSLELCSPANDNIANAWPVLAMPYNAQQDTGCATTDPTDPIICAGVGSHSVWYKLTPSTTAPYEAATAGSDYDTVLAVFSSVGGQLTQVGCNDDYAGTLQSRVVWTPQMGVDYYLIEITSFGGSDGGMLNLGITSSVPANDECLQATIVGPLPYTASQDTTYATQGEFDPALWCGDPVYPKGGHSVWYKFTPSEAGDYKVNTANSDYDTVLAVHTGYCNAYTLVACDDDGLRPQSELTWHAAAGITYFIEITSYGTSAGGNLTLNIDRVLPANDNCADAEVLSAPSDTVTQSTRWATMERNEPTPTCHSSYNTVWFAFTPASAGVAIISTAGSSFDTVLAVYTGECGRGNYTQIACNDDAVGAAPGTRWSALAAEVEAGVVYLVQVGSYTLGNTGDLVLRFDIGPPCKSISQIKCLPIGSSVTLCDAVLTGYFMGFPEVQQLDRGSGIHLTTSSPQLAAGTVVVATGQLARSPHGNLYVQGGAYAGTGTVAAKPLGMITAAVGGSALCNQAGAPGGMGPSNISLLVKVWGRVTGVDAVNRWYWIDDGCALAGAPPYTGLRVWTERTTLPSVGEYVQVVGWPWLWDPGNTPLIREPWTGASEGSASESPSIDRAVGK
jgi:hypothetical protein